MAKKMSTFQDLMVNNPIGSLIRKLFNNNCSMNQNSIGIVCGIYIIYLLAGLIFNLINFISLDSEILTKIGRTPYLIEIIFNIFEIIFIYNACYMCNGFAGFVLMVVITLLLNRFVINKFVPDEVVQPVQPVQPVQKKPHQPTKVTITDVPEDEFDYRM